MGFCDKEQSKYNFLKLIFNYHGQNSENIQIKYQISETCIYFSEV